MQILVIESYIVSRTVSTRVERYYDVVYGDLA